MRRIVNTIADFQKVFRNSPARITVTDRDSRWEAFQSYLPELQYAIESNICIHLEQNTLIKEYLSRQSRSTFFSFTIIPKEKKEAGFRTSEKNIIESQSKTYVFE